MSEGEAACCFTWKAVVSPVTPTPTLTLAPALTLEPQPLSRNPSSSRRPNPNPNPWKVVVNGQDGPQGLSFYEVHPTAPSASPHALPYLTLLPATSPSDLPPTLRPASPSCHPRYTRARWTRKAACASSGTSPRHRRGASGRSALLRRVAHPNLSLPPLLPPAPPAAPPPCNPRCPPCNPMRPTLQPHDM